MQSKITERGGRGIAVYCDHSSLEEVERLFHKVDSEQNGQLDILVNNAYTGVNDVLDLAGKKFYECDPLIWDKANNAGLRGHYICTVLGARMMVKRRTGLIVIVSSMGGLKYLFNVAYGVGKAACDRLGTDCGFELRNDNVACVTLWPGPVPTELMTAKLVNSCDPPVLIEPMTGLNLKDVFANGESTEFPGKAVVHLATDPNVMTKTGRVLASVDLAEEYGFTDVDGSLPANFHRLKDSLDFLQWKRLAAITPSFLKIPPFIFTLIGSKF